MKTPTQSELFVFNGRRYRRYPDSPRKSHRRYFSSGPRLLHRDIWAHHNQRPVPEGAQVWFQDGDVDNLAVDNLVLATPEMQVLARQMAADWHRSEVGRDWHREHMKESLAKPVDNC